MGLREFVDDEGCGDVTFLLGFFANGLGCYACCFGEGYVGNGS